MRIAWFAALNYSAQVADAVPIANMMVNSAYGASTDDQSVLVQTHSDHQLEQNMFDQLGDILSDNSQLLAQVEMDKAADTPSQSDDDDLSDDQDPEAKYFKKSNPTTRKNFPTLHDLAKEEVEKESSTTAKAGKMAGDAAEAASQGMKAISGFATEEKKTEAKLEKKNEKKQKKEEKDEKVKDKKEKDDEKEKDKEKQNNGGNDKNDNNQNKDSQGNQKNNQNDKNNKNDKNQGNNQNKGDKSSNKAQVGSSEIIVESGNDLAQIDMQVTKKHHETPGDSPHLLELAMSNQQEVIKPDNGSWYETMKTGGLQMIGGALKFSGISSLFAQSNTHAETEAKNQATPKLVSEILEQTTNLTKE